MCRPTYCIDFETVYSKDYSITLTNTWEYVYDKRFDAYLVAVHGKDFKWVGHPSKFDWSLIKGALLIAHNASFDSLVVKRLREDGIIPADCIEAGWFCTADMAAYLSAPRDLKRASKELLGIDADKSMRDKMKGKTYQDAVNSGEEDELLKYGGTDAELSYLLWEKYHDQWPQVEQEYSAGLREDHRRGLPADKAMVEASVKSLTEQLAAMKECIPWADEKAILSYPAFRAECRKEGLNCPASVAKTSIEGNEFMDANAEKYPWMKAFRDIRSCNGHLKRFETVRDTIRDDGTMYLQIKYFGTHTGREAAGSNEDNEGDKFNPLNMPKKSMFGCDLRHHFRAPKGFVFGVVDYSQVEAIYLAWRVGDQELLDAVIKEGNLYQAYARKVGWFTGVSLKKEDDFLYQRSKVTVLGAGYQAGPPKFRHVAKVNYGLELTEKESEDLIYGYRRDNPRIVRHWAQHQLAAQLSANHRDKTHEVVLRSGRVQTYFDPQYVMRTEAEEGKKQFSRQVGMRTFMGGPLKKVYGGLLTENEIQASTRDILRDARVACRKAGHQTIFGVYDEIVFLFPESEAEDRLADASRIMVSSSPWAKGCPLGVDAHLTPYYRKF